MLVRKTLEHAGYLVVTASNGMTAVRQYELNRPCMLIVDLMMPTLDGEEFLRMLGSTRPPVLLLTASARREEVATKMGVELSMGKPFDIREIQRVANEHCAEHRSPERGDPEE